MATTATRRQDGRRDRSSPTQWTSWASATAASESTVVMPATCGRIVSPIVLAPVADSAAGGRPRCPGRARAARLAGRRRAAGTADGPRTGRSCHQRPRTQRAPIGPSPSEADRRVCEFCGTGEYSESGVTTARRVPDASEVPRVAMPPPGPSPGGDTQWIRETDRLTGPPGPG